MKFGKDRLANQRIIMELAARKLESVLKLRPPREYIWRLHGAIKLLRHPPEKNDGRFKG